MKRATVTIEGMSCGGCVASVERVLAALAGADDVRVEVGRATLRYDDARLTEPGLRAAIEGAGFDVAAVSISDAT